MHHSTPSNPAIDRVCRAVSVACAALLLSALLPTPALAILERAGEHIHDAGAFRLFMTNLGVVGNPTYPSFSDHPSLEWPAGSAHEFLLEAGIWIGARDRRANLIGVSTSVPVNEFRPGLDPVDRIYASFDGARGTRRFGTTPEAAEADDDGDGRIDEEFLNGKDEDGDGAIDEDYVALGAQSFACEFRDDTPEAQSQLLAHVPMLLRTRQQSFTWAEGAGALDRCAVLRYQVTNDGAAPLYDLLLGFFVDPDVGPKAREGYWRDDRYSIETISGTFAAQGEALVRGCEEVPFEIPAVIVEDVPDGQPGAAGGDVPGMLATLILDHSTHPWGYRAPETVGPLGIIHLRGRASADRTREEISDVEKYDLMASGRFMGNTTTDDHRFVMVTGPFSELPVGHSLDLTVALILAADRSELHDTVAALMQRFHGRWLNIDGSNFTGRSGREYCLTTLDSRFCGFSPMMADHDCDEPQTRVRTHAGCRNSFIQSFCPDAPLNRCTDRIGVTGTGCRYVDFDCNTCTPNIIGGETLVRWADTETRVSSRPIAKRITAGDRAVAVEWDNAAELPTAARELPPVVGYQVWRADGWTRPPGSSGPSADQWALVATLPLPWSGLPGTGIDFVVDGVDIVDLVPGPEATEVPHYAVGRYRFEDDGVLNGFAVFYDVTPFAVEPHSGSTIEAVGLAPRAAATERVYPVEDASATAQIRVVPNPYVESAAWDLEPTRSDPSGRKIAFTGLPGDPARIDIFSLSGDLVRRLEHHGGIGSVDWDLLSRNGQPVVAGIYLYVVEGPGLLHRGRLVIVR